MRFGWNIKVSEGSDHTLYPVIVQGPGISPLHPPPPPPSGI